MRQSTLGRWVMTGVLLPVFMAVGEPPAARSDDTIETIVFLRHGEKAVDDLGQLSCQVLIAL
jgi:hypothetical protein